jgi:hypothetical protein
MLIFGGIPAAVSTVGGLINGIPWWLLIPLFGTTFLVFTSGSYIGLRGYDYVVARSESRKELSQVADALQGMLKVGHETLQIRAVVDQWASPSSMDWNVKLRTIKEAVSQNKIRAISDGMSVSKKTSVNVEDVIALLRSGEIEKIWDSS